MARDYAKTRKPAARRKTRANTRKTAQPAAGGNKGWQWYSAGLLSGIFLSFLLYLGTLPPTAAPSSSEDANPVASNSEPPEPQFDFYTLLPEQTLTLEVEPEPAPTVSSALPTAKPTEFFLLQAGSFKQREDADRRRAELLLLGLEPRVEESRGNNGRWFRVYLGPFQSRAKLNKARGLTASQNIDTLLLKRRAT